MLANRLLSPGMTRNVLIPCWIAGCGGVFLAAPPLGVVASVAALLVGVFAIPAIAFIPRAGDGPAPHAS
jgi:hypothetical protein